MVEGQKPDAYHSKRRPAGRKMTFKQIAAALGLLLAVLLLAIMYVSLYANVSQCGFERAEMLSKTQKIKSENQLLLAELEKLKSPDRLSSIAESNGMVIASTYDKVVLNNSVRMARADR